MKGGGKSFRCKMIINPFTRRGRDVQISLKYVLKLSRKKFFGCLENYFPVRLFRAGEDLGFKGKTEFSVTISICKNFLCLPP